VRGRPPQPADERTMKKVIAFTILLIFAASVVATGVWAFMADAETSDSIIMAGSLDLIPSVSGTGPAGRTTIVPGGNTANGYVTLAGLLPGDTGSITWVMTDDGTLPGTLSIAAAIMFSDVSQNEVEAAVPGNNTGGNGDLDECLGVTLQRGIGTDESSAQSSMTYLLGGAGTYAAAGGLEAVLGAQNVALEAGGGNDTVAYTLSWYLPSDIRQAGPDNTLGTGDDIDVNENIVQSDSLQMNLTFTLNQ